VIGQSLYHPTKINQRTGKCVQNEAFVVEYLCVLS
jgi:hypothetical protein